MTMVLSSWPLSSSHAIRRPMWKSIASIMPGVDGHALARRSRARRRRETVPVAQATRAAGRAARRAGSGRARAHAASARCAQRLPAGVEAPRVVRGELARRLHRDVHRLEGDVGEERLAPLRVGAAGSRSCDRPAAPTSRTRRASSPARRPRTTARSGSRACTASAPSCRRPTRRARASGRSRARPAARPDRARGATCRSCRCDSRRPSGASRASRRPARSAGCSPACPRCSGGITSSMVATPVRWLSMPVSSMARDGEHSGEVWWLANSAPRAARRSMLGVRASPP